MIRNISGQVIGTYCICNCQYTSADNGICNYHRLSGLTVLLISIFLGGCGIDRCLLARGHGCQICLGILKGFTCGGVGIWYIIEDHIVWIATYRLTDGNGQGISDFSCH